MAHDRSLPVGDREDEDVRPLGLADNEDVEDDEEDLDEEDDDDEDED